MFFFIIIFCNFYDEGVLIKINFETYAHHTYGLGGAKEEEPKGRPWVDNPSFI